MEIILNMGATLGAFWIGLILFFYLLYRIGKRNKNKGDRK